MSRSKAVMRWSRFCHTEVSDRRVLAFFSCIVASQVLYTVCATATNSPPYKRCSLLACLLYQEMTSIVDAHLVTFKFFYEMYDNSLVIFIRIVNGNSANLYQFNGYLRGFPATLMKFAIYTILIVHFVRY